MCVNVLFQVNQNLFNNLNKHNTTTNTHLGYMHLNNNKHYPVKFL